MAFPKLFLSAAFFSLVSTSSSAGQDDPSKRDYRPLSDKGVRIVATRVGKGRELTQELVNKVAAIDESLRRNIDFFEDLRTCKTFDDSIPAFSPTTTVKVGYKSGMIEVGKGKQKRLSCQLESSQISEASVMSVSCLVNEQELNQIASEGVTSFKQAIHRFRTDGVYSLISPSSTFSTLQGSGRCEVSIRMPEDTK